MTYYTMMVISKLYFFKGRVILKKRLGNEAFGREYLKINGEILKRQKNEEDAVVELLNCFCLQNFTQHTKRKAQLKCALYYYYSGL